MRLSWIKKKKWHWNRVCARSWVTFFLIQLAVYPKRDPNTFKMCLSICPSTIFGRHFFMEGGVTLTPENPKMDILIFFDRKSQKYHKMPQKLFSFAPLTLKPIRIDSWGDFTYKDDYRHHVWVIKALLNRSTGQTTHGNLIFGLKMRPSRTL